MAWWRNNRSEVYAATADARMSSFEHRVARLEVEVRDMHGVVMEMRGQMAVDSHFDQLIKRMEAVERSSEIKANTIGRLEGRLEGMVQILAGLKEALSRSSDTGMAHAAKQITVNTFVSENQANQVGEGNYQKEKL